MSYQLDIDEMPESKLRAELDRRNALRDAGLCDYCGRNGSTPNCKFPDRHGEAVRFLERRNRRAAGILEPGTYIPALRPASKPLTSVKAVIDERCNRPPHLQQFKVDP